MAHKNEKSRIDVPHTCTPTSSDSCIDSALVAISYSRLLLWLSLKSMCVTFHPIQCTQIVHLNNKNNFPFISRYTQ